MKKEFSVAQFRDTTKDYTINDIGEFVNDIKRHYELFPGFSTYLHHVAGIYIFDYINFRYHYVDGNFAKIAERSKEYIMDRGLGPKEKIWYEPDQKIFTEKILKANLQFFRAVPEHYRDQYLITCNYRNKTADNQLKNIQQKTFVIRSAPDGTPLAVLGFVSDISAVTDVRDSRLFHSISFVSPNEPAPMANYFEVFRSGGSIFTKRQSEIVNLICEGYRMEEIADLLFIQSKTVDNHKQAIYKVANVRNIAGLVRFAMINGYHKLG